MEPVIPLSVKPLKKSQVGENCQKMANQVLKILKAMTSIPKDSFIQK